MNYVEPIRNKKDVERISNALKPKYSLIWAIGTQIGLRVSDILNLSIDIVGKDSIMIREQKTGKSKKFPLNPALRERIKDYYEQHRINQFVHTRDESYLFIGKKGCKIHRSQVYREITDICNKLGLVVSVGTHTMRKTFGYHHYKQFSDVALLQKIFNHSSPSITLRYIGVTQDEIDDSYANFCLNSETGVLCKQPRNNGRVKGIDKVYLTSLIRDVIKEDSEKIIEAAKKQSCATVSLAEEVFRILECHTKDNNSDISNMAKNIIQLAKDNLQIGVV